MSASGVSKGQRLLILRWIVLFSLFLLVFGLYRFQVTQADKYIRLASENRLRFIRLPASRGDILDANGTPLATNVKTFNLMGYPLDLRREGRMGDIVDFFARQGIPIERDVLQTIVDRQYNVPYNAVTILPNLTMAQIATMVSDPEFPEYLFPLPVSRRVYPSGPLVSHIVGYVGEVTKEGLEKLPPGAYRGGDIIGKGGIEQFYEERLRGSAGEESIEVDASGRRVQVLDRKEPVSGQTIQLTIDFGAQNLAADLLGDRRGAVFAMDVRTGDVKVLYSSPTFDMNPLAWGVSSREWSRLVNDEDRPMMNRVINGTYPPGSTHKVLTLYAALSEGVITERTTFRCNGAFRLGDRVFRCWKRTGHGTVDITESLKDSCDVYLYQAGLKAGIDALVQLGRRFGFGAQTGIDLPGEVSGIVAGREWKRRNIGEKWYPGDTVNYSIGQGFILVTPIQTAVMYAALANGGTLVRPRLVQERPKEEQRLDLSEKYLKILRKGLREVVKGGTGKPADGFGVDISGKTGTAQNPHGEDHAWFVGYAPAEDPKYVAIVLVEGGGKGSSTAGPLVGRMLAYLCRR
ncbi:MAG: penicillin-binding protein 2 [Thermovirgaceae bacterium]